MEYITLSHEAEVSFTEKKSVFIGNACPCRTEEEAIAFIDRIRKKYPDATHNTYAYLLSGGQAKYSDDGEPKGTAGVPILSVIQKGGFTDAVIVVTRYFGGVLLGAGGLVRAYGASARDAANAAKIVKYSEKTEFRVICSYQDYQKLIPLKSSLGIKEKSADFSDTVTLLLSAESESYGKFCKMASEICGGRISVEKTGSLYSE